MISSCYNICPHCAMKTAANNLFDGNAKNLKGVKGWGVRMGSKIYTDC